MQKAERSYPARADAKEIEDSEEDLQQEIVVLLPVLRAYGRSLTRNATEADDLLQETLLKALANIHSFTPGTNLRAWLFTIERNTFYSECRRKTHDDPAPVDPEDVLQTEGQQEWVLKMNTVKEALRHLPEEQREALALVGGVGLSYDEAARVCDCAIGTIKSRVHRGRTELLHMLDVETCDDYLRD